MKKIYSLFLRSTIIVFAMIAITNYIFSQSGVKWATNLNSCSGNDAFGTSNNFWIAFMTNNTAHMWLTPAGNLGLGISNPTYKFDVKGRVHATGNIIADSSITAMHIYAIQKVETDALQVNNLAVFGNEIIVDGNNSSITTFAASLSFGSNNLQTSGNINGNIINANDFNASGNITGNIFTGNAVKVSGLGGNGIRLVTADNIGNLTTFSFSGNSNSVLYGNGTWGLLPQKSPWVADSNGIFPDSTLANTDIFAKRLFVSNSISIGTFRFKNGLPSERDSISAEKRITIYAPSKIELNADTLTMKNRVGIGVANPQSALDVAGDINSSGTVYANNLYAQNSIAIGTLKISNGGVLPPGDIRDSIASPYKLALVSAGREISLISDTVKVGDYNSTVRFDVNGSVRVRDMLWVEDGMIIGREFEGSSARIDTVASKNITATNVAAENVSAERLNADSINTAISRTDTAFAQRLVVDGNAKVKGDATITGNLKVLGSLTGIAGFDSLHVLNKIKVGNSITIAGWPGGGLNHIYTDATGDPTLYIQSNSDNYNTILNANNLNKVGIGTDLPNYKFHLHSIETTTYNPIPTEDEKLMSSNDTILDQQYCCTFLNDSIINIIDDSLNNGRLLNTGTLLTNTTVGTTTFQITNSTTSQAADAGLRINVTGYDASLCLNNSDFGNFTIQAPKGVGIYTSNGGNITLHSSGNIFGISNSYTFRTITTPNALKILANGNIGIGIASPTQKLQVDLGNILVRGTGNFENSNNEATLYLGDVNHYIKSINGSGLRIGTYHADDAISIQQETGNVGIGTVDPGIYKLAVEGAVAARRFKVTLSSFYDNVFDKEYKLTSIDSLEQFIQINKHLPDIPSQKEVLTNGLDIGEFNTLLLKKIEELTLYIIEQNKRIGFLEQKIKEK